MKKKLLAASTAALGMMVLILDSKTALIGAADGIALCVKSVVPSLFPFLVLSGLVTGNLSGISFRCLRPLCRLTGIPSGGESLLLVGLLGGYPMGAQAVSQLYSQKQLSKNTARRLLMFCSNAGPAFLFGIVAQKFDSTAAPWALFAISILSAMLVGVLVPGKPDDSVQLSGSAVSFSQNVGRSVGTMARICGWVVLFRILTAFLDRWFLWMLPDALGCGLTGLLELAGGCCNLDLIEDENLRFLVAALLLNFGGLCVWLQTASVVGELGTETYLKGKLLQALLSTVLAWAAIRRDLWGILLLVFVGILCREAKKRGSNSATVGV